MGCCQSSEVEFRNPSIMQDRENFTEPDQIQVFGEMPEDVEMLIEHWNNKNWVKVISFITKEDLIDQYYINIPFKTRPKSVGSLAILILKKESKVAASDILEVCETYAGQILTAMDKSTDLYISSINFLMHLMDDKSESLKDKLVALGVFTVLLKHFTSPLIDIRTMSSEFASLLYRGNCKRQKSFLELRGEKQLVQLLKRDEDDDTVLFNHIEDILDLVYVRIM